MLTLRTVSMIKKYHALREKINARILKESGGALRLAYVGNEQLVSIDDELSVEQLLAITDAEVTSTILNGGFEHVRYTLGGVDFVTLFPKEVAADDAEEADAQA